MPKLISQPEGTPVVLFKVWAVAAWRKHATTHELENGGKRWRYLLIPQEAVADHMTFNGLAKQFTFTASEK